MNVRIANILALCWVSGLLIGNPVTADPIELRLKLHKGENYACVMEMTQNVTQTIEGDQQTLKQQMSTGWTYDVTGVDSDGVISIEMVYDSIRIKQDFGFHTSEYDSQNPQSYVEPAMKGYAALVGTRLEIKIGDSGKLIAIDGAEELINRMLAEMDLPDSPQKDRIVSGLRRQFGENALSESIAQLTAFYPGRPVSPRDTWNSRLTIQSGFPMDVNNDYDLLSAEDGMASIRVESRILSVSDSGEIEVGPVEIRNEISGSQSGGIEVDLANGLPVRSKIDMEFAGTVAVRGIPGREPQSWPIKADGSVVVTITRK